MTFLAVATAVAGIYSIATDLYLRDRMRVSQRVDVEFLKRRAATRKVSLFKDSGPLVLDVPAAGAGRPGLRRQLEDLVEQSGLDLTPGRLVARSLIAGLVPCAFLGLVWKWPWAALLVLVAGFAAPIVHVRRVRRARLEALLRQLPDAFELMSRVVRAGQTMALALRAVADEFPAPVAAEFALCYEQQNLGLSTEAALRDLARRTGLLEVKIFVLALIVQQQTGGNLAELLDKISAIIRERFQIRGQIRTMTAEGRAQAAVLLVLPLLMFGLILLVNRDYARILLARPQLIVGGLVSEAIGALWIRRIINFDF
jgi:tight adherence protein B